MFCLCCGRSGTRSLLVVKRSSVADSVFTAAPANVISTVLVIGPPATERR